MTLRLELNKSGLNDSEIATLEAMRHRCARRILFSTTLAASGHPGGSLSALDMLLVTYGLVKHNPQLPRWEGRDRVVVSMGHISPGVYSVLSEYGYFSEDDFLAGFRRTGSGFPGHIESIVPGVEWDTGNLGQGLSAAVGMAQAFKAKGQGNRVLAFMGDGEHQKGQIVEAVRYAHKYKLDNLTVFIDRNHQQICGTTEQVMPQSIRALYESQGWKVVYLEDGHDYNALYLALNAAYQNTSGIPTVIVARTIMGKGISFMEDLAKYHGSPLSREQLEKAMTELQVENDYEKWAAERTKPVKTDTIMAPRMDYPEIDPGMPILYDAATKTDNRSAYGNALHDLAKANNVDGAVRVAGISCDLEGSVKMGDFHKHSPQAYFESGIQEHHAAAMGGAMSCEGVATFFSTFGSFAASEVYNQNRLSDFNHSHLKIVATHVGLDVGEDGPTHQCIDYLGLFKNLFHFSVLMPADPNQTDRIVRYVAANPGNFFVGMGRSKTPVITDETGKVFYGTDYVFTPGKGDWLRRGEQATIITYGALTPNVIDAWQLLRNEGVNVGVINMASLLPLDREIIKEAAALGPVLTVEDHHVETGLGVSVATVLQEEGCTTKLRRLGVRQYGGSGKPKELYARQGLDPQSIAEAVKETIGK